jgi:hypothetical protein
MPIEVFCDSCQKKLRVPDTAAGKRIKCPKCQGVINVPAAVASGGGGGLSGPVPTMPTIPTPSKLASKSSGAINVPKMSTPTPKSTVGKTPSKAAVEQWFVQTEDGQQYGPVSRTELDQWYAEGRVTTETQLLRDGGDQWQWASDIYPDLAPQQPAGGAVAGGIPDFGAMTAGGGAPAGGSGPFDFSAPSASTVTTSGTSRGKKGGKKKGGKKGGSPNLDILGICFYVLGGLYIVGGIAIMVAGGAMAAALSGTDGAGVGAAGGGVFAVVGIMTMLFSSIFFAAGYGLQQRASWARMLTLVLAIIGALSFSPINIGFAVWCWIVLTDKDNMAAFG